jgi:hypothetical protein
MHMIEFVLWRLQSRLLGPAEDSIGILMCGLATGFSLAMSRRIHEARIKRAGA